MTLANYAVASATILPSGFVQYRGLRPGVTRADIVYEDGATDTDDITVALSAPQPLEEDLTSSRDSIFVQWRTPPDTDAVTRIDAQLRPAGTTMWTQQVQLQPWSTGHLFSDLDVQSNYDVEVYATNQTGRGPTDIRQISTLSPPPPPNPPTVTHSETPAGIRVTWAAAAGPRANVWYVRYRTTGPNTPLSLIHI